MLEQAHQVRTRQELRHSPNWRSAIAAGSMFVVDFFCESLTLFFLPCRSLLTGNQAGASTARNFPSFEQPAGAIWIGSQTAWIAAQPAVYFLNHDGIREAHRPFDAVNRQRQCGTVSSVCRDECDSVHIPGDICHKAVNADVA